MTDKLEWKVERYNRFGEKLVIIPEEAFLHLWKTVNGKPEDPFKIGFETTNFEYPETDKL